MTDRKLTCVACKSAITEGDIAHSDLEFGGELKATNQPEYTADADTDLVATVGTLDEYTPMVRTTGEQTIAGAKTFTSEVTCVKTGLPHFVAGQVMSSAPPLSNVSTTIISMQPVVDGVQIANSANLNVTFYPNGAVELWANVTGSDGNLHKVSLADGRTFT